MSKRWSVLNSKMNLGRNGGLSIRRRVFSALERRQKKERKYVRLGKIQTKGGFP